MNNNNVSAPRCAALVGPYLSGKTTLLESILWRIGALGRRGSVKSGSTLGDASPEARQRQMSTEPNIASGEYLGDPWTFIDCPGFIELCQDTYNALMVADVAVIVAEPEPERALTLSPVLRFLDQRDIPHMVFINKVEQPGVSIAQTLEALQSFSERPLVLRELPIRSGEEITGFVDLASERAFKWQSEKPSELIKLPDTLAEREQAARNEMLEALADFDDVLLEKLLEDALPSPNEIYDGLSRDLANDYIVPVFFGSAEAGHGITRLLKALRHETPGPATAARRDGIETSAGGEPCGRVFKTLHVAHTGKLSLARVWQGEITDGIVLNGERVSGVNQIFGQKYVKLASAKPGDVVALGRLDNVATSDCVSASGDLRGLKLPEPVKPLFAIAVYAKNRSDEVKLTSALARLVEEDPSISFGHVSETGELLLWGQGEMHLSIAADRLSSRFNVDVDLKKPRVPYKETIRKSVSQHSRHKKQSGGHGEFGDVHVDIRPLPRGSGFEFADTITGGVVPKQYIPAVEAGVRDFLRQGPLGFDVVDVAVTLTDGQYHSVDSSEMAFRKAAQLAMREGMAKCDPVLLEPILKVSILLPRDFTSRIQRLISGRRGQIVGFSNKEDHEGWDEVEVLMPQAEMHGLIVDIRSSTLGLGSFTWQFDHLQELTGKLAEDVIGSHNQN